MMADVDEETMTLKKHVRAAREWLGEAEESIDGDDAIRGDLSLMLAQAELTHAKEKAELSPRRRWTSRLMPLSLAVIIAFVIWSAWPVSRGLAPAATSEGNVVPTVTETSAEAKGHSETDVHIGDANSAHYATEKNGGTAVENKKINETLADEIAKENIVESSNENINENINDYINEVFIEEKFSENSDANEARKIDAANVESVPVVDSKGDGVPPVEMQKLMSAAAEHLRAQ